MGDNNVLYVRSQQRNIEGASGGNEGDIWDDTALILAYDHAVNLAKSEVEQRMNGVLGNHNFNSSDSSLPTPAVLPATTTKSSRRNKQRWSVGDACRSVFTDDGITYEADILEICNGGVCTVRYVGYNNEEEVHLNDLKPSHGQTAREKQKRDATQEMPCAMDISDGQDDEEPNVFKKRDGNLFVRSPVCNMGNEFHSTRRSNQGESSRSRHPSGHSANFRSSPRQQHHSMSMPQMMVPPPPPLNLLSAAGGPGDESEALSAMLMSWYMSGFHTGYYQGMKHGNNQVRPQYGRTTPRRHK